MSKQEERNFNIALANSFRDKAHAIEDNRSKVPPFYFLINYPEQNKLLEYYWERFEYYSKKVREYYKYKKHE